MCLPPLFPCVELINYQVKQVLSHARERDNDDKKSGGGSGERMTIV